MCIHEYIRSRYPGKAEVRTPKMQLLPMYWPVGYYGTIALSNSFDLTVQSILSHTGHEHLRTELSAVKGWRGAAVMALLAG